ncbi:DddA-like double-stranded DNA deaminase toxin [Streptomyces sp. NPDC002773]|uniref:DddA-like double-stranded DNA deaminase toxin n=1 Tax=Streptomyces sp. NPDC002773 TaxID=3154430 RepID=UPI003327596A
MDGTKIPAADTDELRMLMSGEHDSLYGRADELLKSSGHELYPYKAKGAYSIASHVETKYAAFMKDNGIQNASVVINNSGVCKSYWNCTNAVEAILPVGSTLKVCYPGSGSPVTLYGKRVRP